jgi:hypothetical protein
VPATSVFSKALAPVLICKWAIYVESMYM